MARIPAKLKVDPIAEAVFEIRFGADAVSEIVTGQLATLWPDGAVSRLPAADIPAPIRASDPNLRVQPTLEIRLSTSGRTIKIGDRALSYHVLRPYPGWSAFSIELSELISKVFSCGIHGFKTERLGFRYINLLDEAHHSVVGLSTLNLRVEVAGVSVAQPFNLNYTCTGGPSLQGLVRISSPEFVLASDARVFSAFIDVDVYTPEGATPHGQGDVQRWTSDAHEFLKNEFFNLFTTKMFEMLVEEW